VGGAASVRADLSQAVASVRSDLAGAIGQQAEAAGGTLAPLLERAVEGAVGAASRHVAEVRAELESDRAARLGAESAREAQAAAAQAQSAEREDARAAQLAARWSEATATLEGAAQRMATVGERDEARGAALERLLAAMDSQREALTSATTGHLTAVDALLATVDARTKEQDAQARADHEALVQAVEETRAGAAERVAAFEAQLAQAHATYAQELATSLAGHAQAAQADAARTAEVIEEAALLVRSGGAELTAVAEMFAGTVDRQREAAKAWLESLGGVEAAVEQASDTIAARGFGEQLDRARELFDVQLQFHRELLVQLHASARAASSVIPDDGDGDGASIAPPAEQTEQGGAGDAPI
jgi:hypothetical protein